MAWDFISQRHCVKKKISLLFCFTWTESKEEDELDWMDVLVLGVGRREGMCYLGMKTVGNGNYSVISFLVVFL